MNGFFDFGVNGFYHIKTNEEGVSSVHDAPSLLLVCYRHIVGNDSICL